MTEKSDWIDGKHIPTLQARAREKSIARIQRTAAFKARVAARKTQPAAGEALCTLRKQEFLTEARAKIAQLTAIVDRIETIERPHWGDVGDLTDIADALAEIVKDHTQSNS